MAEIVHEIEGKSDRKECPSCRSVDTSPFYEVRNTPVNSVLNVHSRNEALEFPTGNINLRFCHDCGFIYNAAFEPKRVRYSSECEESQGYSPTFNAFARKLADRLINRYDLHHKRILEIGCGKGEFLKLMCKGGQNTGIGFDPAYVSGRGEPDASEHVKFVSDYFSEKYCYYTGDFICCRMTLEHILETAQMVRCVRKCIGNKLETVVFFQVPNVLRILKDGAFEDVYYEHCSYFSPGSLARLFRDQGFDLVDLSTTYEEQYVLVEGRVMENKASGRRSELEDDLGVLNELVYHFQKRVSKSVEYWQSLLELHKDRRVIMWGSGSKGVTFLNQVMNSKEIDYVVDINYHRQGTYIAGSGQMIVSPGFLREYRPDSVIVMNAIYVDEIKKNLYELGLTPEIHYLGEQNQMNR